MVMALTAEADPEPARPRRRRRMPGLRASAEEAARHAFLRAVSHELRTPLNAVIGFSEVLAAEIHGPLGAPQYREYALMVRDSGRRLLKLVNQTLEIVRLESGVAELTPGAETLAAAVAEALAPLDPEVDRRGLRLALIDLERAAPVRVDPRALGVMLDTLLRNAVQHSPDGGTVTVQARPVALRVVVEIIDQGPGVPAADLPRLLRPLSGGAPVGGDGMGLSLAIARLLAEASEGALSLRCQPGQGLTAALTLPRA